MKVFLLAIAFFVAITTYGQQGSINDLDLKYGFKEIKLGESVKNIDKFTFIGKSESGTEYYSAKVKSMFIGSVPIKSIDISSVLDLVGYIYVKFNSKNFETVKEVLEYAYGDAKKLSSDNSFMWDGKKVTMMLSAEPGKDGSIFIYSKDAKQFESIDKDIKLNKAKGDL
ncbi:hypothetical protein [Sphingobacterium sp. UGAL515B_05]|uniref:hypothetical protein n=1 Tax=Sphingobacterium sp. UGAL515B_05 TaxID=2986767 RepID=UPI00295443A5|nr:hypothetical protein [Sphingobacterium sp. UGAL515B_05]WON94786.1 hypothetical protein OK025_26570 [Sphingobacterium sp. UGAL515B_05]